MSSWLLFFVGIVAAQATGPPIRVEGFFPRQLPAGRTTVVSVAIPARDAILSAEISPPQGVTVSAITLGQAIQGALTWSELTIEVAKDATPGERTLVLAMPMGRTIPVSITIPSHVPAISELRTSASSNPSTVEVQFAFADADLGESPYVWFTVGCGGDPLVGVVRGKVIPRDKTSGVVRVVIPKPPNAAGGGSQATGTCEMQVRVTDAAGIESNTLRVR